MFQQQPPYNAILQSFVLLFLVPYVLVAYLLLRYRLVGILTLLHDLSVCFLCGLFWSVCIFLRFTLVSMLTLRSIVVVTQPLR